MWAHVRAFWREVDCSVLDPQTTRPGRFQPSTLWLQPCMLCPTQQRPCLVCVVVPPGNRSQTGTVQLLITRMLLLPSRPRSSELHGHGRAWLRGTFITETAPIGTSRVAGMRSKASRHASSLECSRLRVQAAAANQHPLKGNCLPPFAPGTSQMPTGSNAVRLVL